MISYYVSRDIASDPDGSNFRMLDTWSVYSETYVDWDGEPIDGSQKYVSTHNSEQDAENEANRLYTLAKESNR